MSPIPLSTAMHERATMLGDVLTLSETMLSEASDGDWERLAERESERQELVWKLFAKPMSAYERDLHATRLEQVMAISQELTRLAAEHRGALEAEMKQISRGRQAASAYGGGEPSPPRF